MIRVSDDIRKMAIEPLRHIPGASRRALVNALNRAVTAAVGEAERRIGEEYGADMVDAYYDSIQITKAHKERLIANIRSRRGATKLDEFPHSPTKPGTGGRGKPPMTATVRKSGGPSNIPGAFIIPTEPGGNIGIMVWRSQSAGGGLRRVPALAVPFMQTSESVYEFVERRAGEVLEERVAHEVANELASVGRRR